MKTQISIDHWGGKRLIRGEKRFPISRLLGVALMLAVVSGTAGNAVADPKRFVLTPLAFLGDQAPGGETFFGVFESNVINNRGDVLFGSNVTTEDAAAVFLLRRRVTSEIARTGETGSGAPPRRLREPGVPVPHHPQREGRCGLRLSARTV